MGCWLKPSSSTQIEEIDSFRFMEAVGEAHIQAPLRVWEMVDAQIQALHLSEAQETFYPFEPLCN